MASTWGDSWGVAWGISWDISGPEPEIIVGGRQNSKWQQGVKKLQTQRPHFASDDVKRSAAILSRIGGIARAKALTPTQRSKIASTAAKARWK